MRRLLLFSAVAFALAFVVSPNGASASIAGPPTIGMAPAAAFNAMEACPAADQVVHRAADPAPIVIEAIMKPSQGRTVLYHQGTGEKLINGTITHPAIVTRVHGDDDQPMVNLQVFFDTGPIEVRSSVQHYAKAPNGGSSWDWPPRQT